MNAITGYGCYITGMAMSGNVPKWYCHEDFEYIREEVMKVISDVSAKRVHDSHVVAAKLFEVLEKIDKKLSDKS